MPATEPAITITVTGDCDCPICGATELVDKSLPVSEWRWQVRPNKVEIDGLWWSECLPCKATYGNGWFAIEPDGSVVIDPSRIAAMREAGHDVTVIEMRAS